MARGSCLACLFTALSVIAGPAVASAETRVGYFYEPRFGGSTTYVEGSDGVDSVAVHAEGHRYLVSDPEGVRTDDDCVSLSSTLARCPGGETWEIKLEGGDDLLRLENFFVHGTAAGGDGDDVLEAEKSFLGLLGGGGSDTVTSTRGAQKLVGGSGADLVRGGAGDDRLDGGSGRDTLLGGAGDDRVRANLTSGNDRDAAIRCGGGSDLAFLDRSDSPPHVDCEKLRVVEPE